MTQAHSLSSQPSQSHLEMLKSIGPQANPATFTKDVCTATSSILNGDLNVASVRELLGQIVSLIREAPTAISSDDRLAATTGFISQIKDSTVAASYHEQLTAGTLLAADIYESDERFGDAAKCLAEVPLESTQRKITNTDRVRVWMRIVRNWLEDDEPDKAALWLNKIKNVFFSVEGEFADAAAKIHQQQQPCSAAPSSKAAVDTAITFDELQELNLHYGLAQARIHDAHREFLAAAAKYHEISFSQAVAEEDRLEALHAAVRCTVLAPAGPTRTNMLARLYRDERVTQQMQQPQQSQVAADFAVLEKLFLERLLYRDEVQMFAKGLKPHQLAITADGNSVLDRAVVDHNLLAVSKLYDNIGLDELGSRLDLPADKAEITAARMIEQGRLHATIDQIGRRVWFQHQATDDSAGNPAGAAAEGSGAAAAAGLGQVKQEAIPFAKEMNRSSSNALGVINMIEAVATAIQRKHPALAAQYLDD